MGTKFVRDAVVNTLSVSVAATIPDFVETNSRALIISTEDGASSSTSATASSSTTAVLRGGAGGTNTSSGNSGRGGAVSLLGGRGGDAQGAGNADRSGGIVIQTGASGDSLGGGNGGNTGDINILSLNGGSGSGAGVGGNSGDIEIGTGNGGSPGGNAGNVDIDLGTGNATGNDGQFLVNGTGFITATFNQSLPAGMTDQAFFVCPRAYIVKGIRAVWTTAETAGGNISIRRAQGTENPTQGDLLTAAVIDGTGAANTAFNPALTATTENLILTAGNRLTIQFEAAQTELAGVAITVLLAPSAQ